MALICAGCGNYNNQLTSSPMLPEQQRAQRMQAIRDKIAELQKMSPDERYTKEEFQEVRRKLIHPAIHNNLLKSFEKKTIEKVFAERKAPQLAPAPANSQNDQPAPLKEASHLNQTEPLTKPQLQLKPPAEQQEPSHPSTLTFGFPSSSEKEPSEELNLPAKVTQKDDTPNLIAKQSKPIFKSFSLLQTKGQKPPAQDEPRRCFSQDIPASVETHEEPPAKPPKPHPLAFLSEHLKKTGQKAISPFVSSRRPAASSQELTKQPSFSYFDNPPSQTSESTEQQPKTSPLSLQNMQPRAKTIMKFQISNPEKAWDKQQLEIKPIFGSQDGFRVENDGLESAKPSAIDRIKPILEADTHKNSANPHVNAEKGLQSQSSTFSSRPFQRTTMMNSSGVSNRQGIFSQNQTTGAHSHAQPAPSRKENSQSPPSFGTQPMPARDTHK